jgi:glycosyltransferase involved in cell wall biosynthesis
MRNIKGFYGKEFDDLISVIIPLYKGFDSERVKISIDSLKQQKSVNLEISIAEQSEAPSFKLSEGITYSFVPEDILKNNFASPGKVRNKAALSSSGKYLYNSDGDIVYLNPFYFAEMLELIKTGKNVVLYRPPMRRLPLEDFKTFSNAYQGFGLQKTLDLLDMSEDFCAKIPESSASIIPIIKKESGRIKTFLFSNSDFKKYLEDPSLKGSEPQYSTLNIHAGGTFVEREQFLEIGGFCEEFAAWGCHDADLQWKLKEKFNLIEIPRLPEYEVLHLDHKRGYFNKDQWQANRDIQQNRKLYGVEKAILEDKTRNGN